MTTPPLYRGLFAAVILRQYISGLRSMVLKCVPHPPLCHRLVAAVVLRQYVSWLQASSSGTPSGPDYQGWLLAVALGLCAFVQVGGGRWGAPSVWARLSGLVAGGDAGPLRICTGEGEALQRSAYDALVFHTVCPGFRP